MVALGLSLATTGGLTFAFAAANANASVLTQPAELVAATAAPGTSIEGAATGNGKAVAGAATDSLVVNGAIYRNKWGPVQVQASFGSDGSLADVVVLQSPSADGKSIRINDRAVPVLNSEALTAKSANVDTVSGATYTSNDYRRSLQSAIDTARAAQVTQQA